MGSIKNYINMYARPLQLIAAFLLLVVICINSDGQDDYWRHLAIGKLIVGAGAIPLKEPFALWPSSPLFIDYSWLSAVVFYLAHSLCGDAASIVLSSVIISATLLVAALRKDCTPLSAVVAILLIVPAIEWRFAPRPEVFGLLFFVLLLNTLNASIKPMQKTFITFCITLAWVNFHSTFIFAVILSSIYFISECASKKKIAIDAGTVVLATVIACFCNPWLYHLVYESIRAGLHPLNQVIIEFKPLRMDQWLPYRLPVLLFLCIRLCVHVFKKKVNNTLALNFLFSLLMAIKYARALPLPMLVAAPILTADIDVLFRAIAARVPRHRATYMRIVLFIVLSITTILDRMSENYGLKFEQYDYYKAVQLLIDANVSGPILNAFAQGGYLMWRGPDRFKLFIDNRSPIYIDTTFPIWNTLYAKGTCTALEKTFDFEAILLPPPSPCPDNKGGFSFTCYSFTECYADEKKWALVFWSDEVLLLLKRSKKYASYIEKNEYKWIRPYSFSAEYYLEFFKKSFLVPGAEAGIMNELRRAILITPTDRRALVLFGLAKEAMGLRHHEDAYWHPDK